MRDLQLLKAAVIVFAFLMFLCAVGSCEATTPPWVKEFRAEIKKADAKTSYIYEVSQYRLSVFKKTGVANCVGFAKLMAEIAMKHGQKIEWITMMASEEQYSHRVSLFRDSEGWWMQSNWRVYRIAKDTDVVDWSDGKEEWKVVRRWNPTKEDLEDDNPQAPQGREQ